MQASDQMMQASVPLKSGQMSPAFDLSAVYLVAQPRGVFLRPWAVACRPLRACSRARELRRGVRARARRDGQGRLALHRELARRGAEGRRARRRALAHRAREQRRPTQV